ncbi:hypothetical protein MIMGU_mgv1a020425mg, partial [Erythranthe guttata]
SDDDEIDYSAKPEFYDPKIDERNEKWVKKQRRGFNSDAVLSCPACFTTLSFDCQRRGVDVVMDIIFSCENKTNRNRND